MHASGAANSFKICCGAHQADQAFTKEDLIIDHQYPFNGLGRFVKDTHNLTPVWLSTGIGTRTDTVVPDFSAVIKVT